MRILITGGAGFIGSHLVEHFQGRASIKVLDNLSTGSMKYLKGFEVELMEGSILNRSLVSEAVKGVDYIFHLAAIVSVPESVENPVECQEINVLGLLNVLEAASAAKVKKLCFSSSAAIYGNNPSLPKVETMRPEPRSPYAISKLDGELFCEFYQREGRVNTVCLRFFNVFGPRQSNQSSYSAAVPVFIEKALRNEPLTILGDGNQTCDFIYVKDIVNALTFVAFSPKLQGVFNAGYGKSMTINKLAQQIITLAGSDSKLVYGPERVSNKWKCAMVRGETNAATFDARPHPFGDRVL